MFDWEIVRFCWRRSRSFSGRIRAEDAVRTHGTQLDTLFGSKRGKTPEHGLRLMGVTCSAMPSNPVTGIDGMIA